MVGKYTDRAACMLSFGSPVNINFLLQGISGKRSSSSKSTAAINVYNRLKIEIDCKQLKKAYKIPALIFQNSD